MPKSKADPKDMFVSVRVTPGVKSMVLKEALADGLTISEWIRGLVIRELAARNKASSALETPRGV